MEVITINELCRFMSLNAEVADTLIQLGILKTVTFGDETLVTMPSVTGLMALMEAD